MEVRLKDLKPNPYRDFTVDPIDEANVDALAQSIKQDGFWGGIVCRSNGHGIQIGAGHHRVAAAIRAGIKEADVFVGRLDDAAMIRVYAVENATQRGNSGTAIAGSVASAIRFLAKAILTGQDVSRILETSAKGIETIRGQLQSEKGLGQTSIVTFLANVPGINDGIVQQQLGNLKASGDYSRIVKEVHEEIEQENKEAFERLARAEREQAKAAEAARKAEEQRKEAAAKAKAAREEADKKRAELASQRAEAEAKLAEKRRKESEEEMKKFEAMRVTRDTAQRAVDSSAKREVTFDFEGVAKHLKNANQIDVFRKLVTELEVQKILPVNQQAAVAKQLVTLGKELKEELSGRFIDNNIRSMIFKLRTTVRKLDREEQRQLEINDWMRKVQNRQHEFCRGCGTMYSAGQDLFELQKQQPKGVEFPISSEFRKWVKEAQKVIDKLATRLT